MANSLNNNTVKPNLLQNIFNRGLPIPCFFLTGEACKFFSKSFIYIFPLSLVIIIIRLSGFDFHTSAFYRIKVCILL